MANEIIKVNLIPGVDDPTPILHFSQYDNGRTFIIEMYNGDDPFDCDAYNVTLECRKRDNNIVILTADTIDNNQITFHSIEQLCACYGDNDSEIVIRDNNDLVIGSGNIIINVEKSPTCGGIQSETVIDNITQQIAQIVPEVIGEDYYNKTQTDTLLANKANADDVYNKTQTDALLANKANADDVYNKTQTDALLANKANADDVYNKTQTDALLANKADKATTYTKAQVDELLFNMLPIGKASGAIATFETNYAGKLKSLSTTIVAKGGGGTPSTPIPIVGHSEVNFKRCGVNLWDGVTESGFIYNGSEGSDSSYWRTKNYIPIVPNTEYYFRAASGNGQINWYDINKVYISAVNSMGGPSRLAVSPANAAFVRFYQPISSDANDTGVNYPSSDIDYHAYNGQTITLALGQTVYGGRLYYENGWKCDVTHNIVDLGSLNWNASATNTPNVYRMSAVLANKPTTNNQPFDAICEVYSAVSANTTYTCNMGISGSLGGTDIYVYDADYNTSTSAADFKTAMSGKYLVYPLATPFTIDLSSSDMLDAVVGINNVFSDCGVTTAYYKDTIQHYIDSRA